MPISEEELKHLGGDGVVVRYQYGNEITTYPLEEGSDEGSMASELWQEAAFTNGNPLIRITLEWAPDEAKALVSGKAEDAPTL